MSARLRHLWLVDDCRIPSPLGEQLRVWIGAFQGGDHTWSAATAVQGAIVGFDRLVIAEARTPHQIAELCTIIVDRQDELRTSPNALCIIAPTPPPILPKTLEAAGFRLKTQELTAA